MSSFADLGVPADLVTVLAAQGIDAPFPIQGLTVADALAGRDVCGKARTGSGKTLAFGLPLVATLRGAAPKRPLGLVLVPTRELAAQVTRELTWLGKRRGVQVSAVYGGASFGPQLKALRRGVDVLVACPGRLTDLLERGAVDLGAVRTVVVDEADRMADMGFLPVVRALLERTPATRQTLLFSATLDGAVDALVRDFQRDPVHHEVATAPDEPVLATHHFWRVHRDDRVPLTAEVIAAAGPTIVFCRTKHGTDGLARKLERIGVSVQVIHGNRSQPQRERALAAFARGDADALLATDVAARGIHVDDVACVVHFDPPNDEKDYTHRSGRTARAGSRGMVVSMVMPDQVRGVERMQRTLKLPRGVQAPDVASLVVDAPADEPRGRVRTDAMVAVEPAPVVQLAAVRDRSRGRGRIKFYDTKRGFGFIDRGAGADLFVHHSALDVNGRRLREGELVEFDVASGRKGDEARNVRLAG